MRDAIEAGNIPEAIILINKVNPELMDANRLLAFHLQVSSFLKKKRKFKTSVNNFA